MSRPRLRGHIWFIRRYGLRRWHAYERDRRAGLTIDYSKVFTLDELAILEEHGLSTWGKKIE
jgi:hypothetical protein